MPSPDLTVVVAADDPRAVTGTLAGLARQRRPPGGIEVIVARAWPAAGPPGDAGDVRFLDVGARSHTALANAGCSVATGPVILLLAAGDLPEGEDLLTGHLAAHAAESVAAVLGSPSNEDLLAGAWTGPWPANVPWPPSRNVSVSRAELAELRGLDERIPQLDVAVVDLVCRLAEGRGRVEVAAGPRTLPARLDPLEAGRSARALAALAGVRGTALRPVGSPPGRVAQRWLSPLLRGRLASRAAFARGQGLLPLPLEELARGGLDAGAPPAQRPPVAVICPFAGDPAEGAALIAALARVETGPQDEIVVVDNSRSPVLEPSSDIAVVRADGEWSSYHARNVGARATVAPWLLFLDADCRPFPGILDAYFSPAPAAATGAVAGAVLNPADAHGWVARWSAQVDVMSQTRPLSREARPFAVTANLLVRREALDQLGGFAEGIRGGGDVDLSWRLADAGWAIEYRQRAAAEHVHRASLRALLRQYARYGGAVGWLGARHPGETGDWFAWPPHAIREPVLDVAAGRFEAALARLTALATIGAARRGQRRGNRPPN